MIGRNNIEKDIIGRDKLQYRSWSGIVNPMLMTVPIQANNVFNVMQTTSYYNAECNKYLQTLGAIKEKYQTELNEKLAINPYYYDDRQKGVRLAWKYEQADIKMGGTGSANWDETQRQEILDIDFQHKYSVRNSEGHHQRDVTNHPEDQTNPDNIKFYKSKSEHLEKGHNGDWKNESDAPMIDKDEMLKHTNKKRVWGKELTGAGVAALIGFATGATIGFIVSLAQNGLSPESFRQATIEGGRLGLEGAALGVIGHITTRTIGEVATNAMTGFMANAGVEITQNIAKACNMGVTGSIIIITSSIYQFIRLKKTGLSTEECLSRVGKQAIISVGSLAISIIVQAVYGGPAALAISCGISAIMVTYSMYKIYHNEVLADKIQNYTIEKTYPLNFA